MLSVSSTISSCTIEHTQLQQKAATKVGIAAAPALDLLVVRLLSNLLL
jgi:hypothetical protein